MANKVVHWELMGPDGTALRDFYAGLFDWNLQPFDGVEGYHTIGAEDTGVGGAVGQGSEDMPSYLTLYVEVDNVDAHLAKAEAAGAKTVAPKTVVPGVVTFGMFADPAGNVVGLLEQEPPPAE